MAGEKSIPLVINIEVRGDCCGPCTQRTGVHDGYRFALCTLFKASLLQRPDGEFPRCEGCITCQYRGENALRLEREALARREG